MSETTSILKRMLMTSSFCHSYHRFCLLIEKILMPSSPLVLIQLDGMLTKIKSNIYAFHNFDSPLPFLKGGSKFQLPPPQGLDSEKLKKGGIAIVYGQVFLKGGGWHFSYLILPRFIIFKFRNYFTLCKIVLSIWRKINFFCHHNFMKKDHSKFSKNEPENIL